MLQQFFYDAQIRRFLLQFTRMISGFQIEYGREEDDPNAAALIRVPVRYGDASRQAQTILQENSQQLAFDSAHDLLCFKSGL